MAVIAEVGVQEVLRPENSVRVVWRLAWPAVALNSLQVINILLDRGFIGHLETPALTAHGGATNVMFMMFSLAIAIQTGATALVSRAYGAGEVAEYRLAGRQSLSVAMFFGVLLAAFTAATASSVSHWLLPANDPRAIYLMTGFVAIYACSMPATYMIQTLAGSLRGIGDTVSPMVISGVQIFLHMSLNFVLIFPSRVVFGVHVPGANLGLAGAVTSLAISSWISAIAYIIFMKRTPLGAQFHIQLPQWHWVVRIMRIAIPAAGMAVVRVLSLTAFTVLLALVPNGSVAIAGMTVAFAIESVMIMPAFGLSAAAAALVGQSLGAKNPARAERLGWTAAHHAGFVTLALCLPIYLAAPSIAGVLLGGKTDVVEQACTLLRYLCVSEVGFVYGVTLFGAMQGAGDTVQPMWAIFFSLWGLRVPLAFLFALKTGQPLFGSIPMLWGLGLGSRGAWIAMAITQGIQGVLAVILFKRGRWKTREV